MELTLILGPMKSGKSFELINHFAPLKYTDTSFALFQSARNVRDGRIESRNGSGLEAIKVHSLSEALAKDYTVIGIDEVHMFPEDDAEIVRELLKKGTRVVAAGLDMDYRGKMFGIVQRLLELGPKDIRMKRAACERCRKLDAVYTQVLLNKQPLTSASGMPSVIPEDGTCSYQAMCRECFVR